MSTIGRVQSRDQLLQSSRSLCLEKPLALKRCLLALLGSAFGAVNSLPCVSVVAIMFNVASALILLQKLFLHAPEYAMKASAGAAELFHVEPLLKAA